MLLFMFHCVFVIIGTVQHVVPQNNIFELRSVGAKFGVATLVQYWFSPDKTKTNSIIINAHAPNEYTVGNLAYRSDIGTSHGKVWTNFGCENFAPWSVKPGSVKYYLSLQCSCYVKIKYSKPSEEEHAIEIYINDMKMAEFYPQNQDSMNPWCESDWIKLEFPTFNLSCISVIMACDDE